MSDLAATFAPLRASPHAWLLRRLLARTIAGRITVDAPDGRRYAGEGEAPGPTVHVALHRWRGLRRLLAEGDVGFAEAYIDQDWSSPDLPSFLEFAARNQRHLGVGGTTAFRLARRALHRARANTRAGSRRNIPAHYDLGNAFYAAWLDAGMTYSSAIFATPGQSLEAAQDSKLARIVAELDVRPAARVLEIGCGWGSLAERIAAAGAHVTGLTLSPAQLAHAQARLAAAGLGGRAELRLQDYRDVAGVFDRVVSIEMLEAVGADYWPDYFARVRACLASHGHAVLQFISIAEDRFATYRRNVDFIQRHIFPGGMLPSVAVVRTEAARAGLQVRTLATFAGSYAATLAAWRRRFLAAWPTLRAGGHDEAFRRKWEYYLAYCEAGFRAGVLDVGLYRLDPA